MDAKRLSLRAIAFNLRLRILSSFPYNFEANSSTQDINSYVYTAGKIVIFAKPQQMFLGSM